MGNSGKYSLVKKAAKIDLNSDSGYVEFLKIAKESGFTKERLGMNVRGYRDRHFYHFALQRVM